jgi:phthiodiolone/phenolphthiodiolone dimycocerosates ketoreductase
MAAAIAPRRYAAPVITADRFTSGITVGTGPPLSRIRMLTRVARYTGFDAVWAVDHFQSFFPQAIWDRDLSAFAHSEGSPHAYYDYQALLGHLAGRVGRMQPAVGVTEVVRRHPVLLAQWAMTMAALSDRPPILGIGAGEAENTTPYGLDFSRPVARLEEALGIIRRCFTSRGSFDHDGEFYRFDGAVMDLAAPKGLMPQMWIAAHGPRMLRLTGQHGDGWYPTLPYTPEGYAGALATIRRVATEHGRKADAIVPALQCFVVIGRTEVAARKMLDSRMVRFVALLAPDDVWRAYGAEHPFGEGFGGLVDFVPETYSRRELDDAIARVPVDLTAKAVIWGDRNAVHARLRDLVDAGLRHLVLQPVSAAISKRDAVFSLRSMVALQRRLKREGI